MYSATYYRPFTPPADAIAPSAENSIARKVTTESATRSEIIRR